MPDCKDDSEWPPKRTPEERRELASAELASHLAAIGEHVGDVLLWASGAKDFAEEMQKINLDPIVAAGRGLEPSASAELLRLVGERLARAKALRAEIDSRSYDLGQALEEMAMRIQEAIDVQSYLAKGDFT
jgi:hypothetical protein